MTTRNDSVDALNSTIAASLVGEEKIYYSQDSVDTKDSMDTTNYSTEFLRSVKANGLPLGMLSLKVGMPVMLLRNYYPKSGLCNGTRMIITNVYEHCIKARVVSQDIRFKDRIHVISRIVMTTEDLTFPMSRKQLPVRTCFAMTINKSQSHTLSTVGVDLSCPVFSHGQLYVALSRVKNVGNLLVLLPNGPDVATTDNVVYPEVLLHPPQESVVAVPEIVSNVTV